MGSRSSTPVKEAKKVEVDHHNDLIELRFDHIATGTAFVVVIVVICLICICFRKRCAKPPQQAYPLLPIQQGALPNQAPPANFMNRDQTWQVPVVWHANTADIINLMAVFKGIQHPSQPPPNNPRPSKDQATVVDMEDDPSTSVKGRSGPNQRSWDI